MPRWMPLALAVPCWALIGWLLWRTVRRTLVSELRFYVDMLVHAMPEESAAERFGSGYVPMLRRRIEITSRKLRWCGGPAKPHEIDRARERVMRLSGRIADDIERATGHRPDLRDST